MTAPSVRRRRRVLVFIGLVVVSAIVQHITIHLLPRELDWWANAIAILPAAVVVFALMFATRRWWV